LEKYAQVRSSDQQSSSGGGVSLDTKEIKYLSYFAHIKRRIERVWTYPPGAIANGLQGQLHLKFVLRNDGQVKTVELLRSSGYKVLDKEAWDAVVNGGPFGPFPPTIPDNELHITARFTYVLDETAQRTRVRWSHTGGRMYLNLWRAYEFRGLDPNHNPFVDFGFVEKEGARLALSSHMLHQPLWVDSAPHVVPTFKRYYEAQGFSNLRYKVLWQEEGPVDTPFNEGWEPM
jgi:TonB family protein